MARYLYSELSSALTAWKHCTSEYANESQKQFADQHKARLLDLVREHMPSGSGFDSGTYLDFDASHAEKLVFTTSFHHMNSVGYYSGWYRPSHQADYGVSNQTQMSPISKKLPMRNCRSSALSCMRWDSPNGRLLPRARMYGNPTSRKRLMSRRSSGEWSTATDETDRKAKPMAYVQTLKTGDSALYDSMSGLIPCKVLSITGESGACGTAQRVRIELTTGRSAYKAGEILETFGLHVVPRKSIRRGKYSTGILFYNVQVD